MVNKQDFSQVFQDSGIGKMEDNLMSAPAILYTGRSGKLSLLTCKKPTPLPVEPRIKNIGQTDR